VEAASHLVHEPVAAGGVGEVVGGIKVLPVDALGDDGQQVARAHL